MYSNIKEFNITRDSIQFQTNEMSDIVTLTTIDNLLDFNKLKCDTKRTYDTNQDGITITIYKNNLVIYKDATAICRFYIPVKVKFLIEKDLNKSGEFSLEYRKHIRHEYDSNKCVFMAMNFIPEFAEDLSDILRIKARRYSTGVINMPVVACFYDESTDSLRYGISKDNIVVESGIIEPEKTHKVTELPNIF